MKYVYVLTSETTAGMPTHKVGRHWRFPKEAVNAWILNRIRPTQAYGRTKEATQGITGGR